MDLNKVMLIGRLTRDPESRTTPQGASVANFGLAPGRVWKDDQSTTQERTEFNNIVAWRRLAEICSQYLRKGRQVYIEGHLQTRSWDGQDGKKNYRTEVVADNIIMLGSRAENEGRAPAATPAAEPVRATAPAVQAAAPETIADEEIRIEEIPF